MSSETETSAPYFARYQKRQPPEFRKLSDLERFTWHFLAGMTLLFGAWYLHWRWSEALNPEAIVFSVIVALAETMTYVGTCIFFFDIWDERDRRTSPKSQQVRCEVSVDIVIATLDEDADILEPSIDAALSVSRPNGVTARIWLLDDGSRDEIERLARRKNIGYLSRETNRGFKAGNLANALYQTRGDYFVICDADTQLFPSFLENTLGYFADRNVAWVQTPHWFFDIPEGQSWEAFVHRKTGRKLGWLARILRLLTGRNNVGQDPFASDPAVFFDIIQRRRNRHGASFCCGAGSIHRRDALFDNCLRELQKNLAQSEQQPFKFHVSEDIFTSIQLHSKAWTSVYHPKVEARMLSPWSVDAWAAQKHKYAGGTFDIMLHANPLWNKGMSLSVKLHYLATFWSYAGVFWFPILLMAPAFSLATGLAPIDAYTFTFFAHLLPVLICNELAMAVGTKGYDTYSGRCLAMGTLQLQLKAFSQVARGIRPKFKPTPKRPGRDLQWSYIVPNLVLATLLITAAVWGCVSFAFGLQSHSLSLLVVNLFWIACNFLLLTKTILVCLSIPAATEPYVSKKDISK